MTDAEHPGRGPEAAWPGDPPRHRDRGPEAERSGEPHRLDPERELECVEWCPICRAADVLRATASPELRGQWQTVQRETLLTMRALIDSYLDRIDHERAHGPRIRDIPIE
ncbi:MAG TPA: hypothetical protein VKG89_03575 [Solirubrobacterales bacterium]|nr:hypothetical protein [Solirubrobacterales bacterium]